MTEPTPTGDLLDWADDRSAVDDWSLDQLKRHPRETIAKIRDLAAEVRALRDQRDAATAVIREAVDWFDDPAPYSQPIVDRLRALLAAVDRPPTGTPDKPRMMQSIWPKKVGVDTVDLQDPDTGDDT